MVVSVIRDTESVEYLLVLEVLDKVQYLVESEEDMEQILPAHPSVLMVSAILGTEVVAIR